MNSLADNGGKDECPDPRPPYGKPCNGQTSWRRMGETSGSGSWNLEIFCVYVDDKKGS